MYAYKVYTYEVYSRDFDVRKIPISPPRLAVLVGIPLYWVACGGCHGASKWFRPYLLPF
jgi:hypothetical protein